MFNQVNNDNRLKSAGIQTQAPPAYMPNVYFPTFDPNAHYNNPINPNLQSYPFGPPMLPMPYYYPYPPQMGMMPPFYPPPPTGFPQLGGRIAPLPPRVETEENEPESIFESVKNPDKDKMRKQYKSGLEIAMEFKANTLPKLRLKRLVKLQALMKGFYVRKFVVPRLRLQNALIEDYVCRKIDEFIQDSMIPDLVMEVITYNKYNQDYSLYSPELRASIEYIDNLIRRVVMKLAREAVNETVNSWVKEYMRKKEEVNPNIKDPIWLLSEDLIIRAITPFCKEIAKESTQDMVNEYIIESQFFTYFKTKLIPSAVHEIAEDAIDECIIEDIIESYVVNIMTNISEPLANLVSEEEYYVLENEELEKAYKSHVERLMLEVLLNNVVLLLNDENMEIIADNAVKFNRFTEIDKEEVLEDLELPDYENNKNQLHKDTEAAIINIQNEEKEKNQKNEIENIAIDLNKKAQTER